jgi:hypothetical protein
MTTRRARGSSGSAVIETAMFLPILILLLMGTLEIGRITYTYFTLHKIMYSLARYLGTQQGTNFCDSSDPNIVAALSFALNGTTDNSGTPIISNLTADMISIRIEQVDQTSGAISECPCAVPGCDAANGGLPPNFLVVSIPNGYNVTPRIPLIPMNPIPLKPQVRVPYGGT